MLWLSITVHKILYILFNIEQKDVQTVNKKIYNSMYEEDWDIFFSWYGFWGENYLGTPYSINSIN